MLFSLSCDPSSNGSAQDTGINLSNRFMSLGFHAPQQGGGLRSIKNDSGFDFINRYRNKSLWRIELKRIPLGQRSVKSDVQRLSLDPEVNDGMARRSDIGSRSDTVVIKADRALAQCSVEKDQNSLSMSWKNIDVEGEADCLDVTVTVTLAENDEYARFRVAFNNRSTKYTVFYLTAPLFNGIYPQDGKTSSDRLASPIYNGRLIVDPIRNGIMDERYRFQPNRSGHSMQFDAYYHDDKGLYLGCFDGMQNVKRYYIAADSSDGLSWAVVHVPDNMKSVPQNWQTSYDSVLRCFKGDWYDACRLYRQWALKQSWTAEGPLYERKSTPKWFKEINMWMRWGITMSPPTAPYHTNIKTGLDGITKGLHLHYWGQGHFLSKGSPDRFPLDQQDLNAINMAKENNYPIMGFLQSVCWDSESQSAKKTNGFEHTVRDFEGQRVVWPLGKPGDRTYTKANVAYPGKVWAKVLGDTVVEMARTAGFSAAYMDSFNHGGTYMNFNPIYSKQVGGGNTYIKDNQKMLHEIKDRVRKVNPDFCFSGESFWEGNMAELDGYLTCNTTYQPLEKDKIFAIPMVQAVYHDYTICFGTWVSRWDLEEGDGRSYIAKFAQAFAWGVKDGWTEPLLLTNHKDYEVALDAAQKRSRAYTAAMKFLVYGEMLRPPAFTDPVEQLDVKWHIRWLKKFYDISLPSVQCSMWRAPDGRLGLVMYNISTQQQKVVLKLNDPAYGIDKAKSGRITSLYPTGSEIDKWESQISTGLTLRCTVPARSPLIYEIELQ